MNRKNICMTLLLMCVFIFSSCTMDTIVPADSISETSPVDRQSAEINMNRYAVIFEENETFSDEIAQRAAEYIDPYIKQAVVILNTVGEHERRFDILDCDYSARPKKRDEITDPLTLYIYDTVLERTLAYEDYYFNEDDYDVEYFFGNFVDATDALDIDYGQLSLYSDTQMGWKTYEDGYYMPGGWLNDITDDRDAIKAEVDFYYAVVDRIIEKMPQNMSNYDKCCYFAFVISLVTEYDYEFVTLASSYPAYAALVQQSCVCKGYAEAFYELCRREGISCWSCSGTTINGDHAWNRVETTEGYVYLDITWYDDPELSDHYRDGYFMYLFMTEEDLEYMGHVVERVH
ncbi:MAG: hypothetical protein IJN27_07140 [Oscillospiraceae bacterium]|nr:hypothetical protein [Oscillospiraceae bacterium]